MDARMRSWARRPASMPRLAAFADTAAFSILVATGFALPLTFSIAENDVFAQPKTILTVGLATALGGLLVTRWIARPGGARLGALRDPLLAALTFFTAWTVAATVTARDPAHALVGEPLQYQGLVAFTAYTVFLAASWTTVRTPGRRSGLLVAIAGGAAVVTAYAILQRMGLDPIWAALPEDRVFSTIGQPNALGAYLVLVLPLILALAYRPRSVLSRLGLIGLAAMIIFATFLTLSRGALLGLVLVMAVLGVALWHRRRLLASRRVVLAGLGVGVVAIVILLAVPELRMRATAAVDRFTDPGRTERASSRAHLDQWAVGVAIALDHPIVGTGPDSYVLVFPEYRDDVLPPDRAEVWSRYRPESPHNVYLAVAGGAGVPALAAYLAIIAIVVGRLRNVMRSGAVSVALLAACLLAAASANLVTDFFMTAETTESTLTWMVLGTGAALADRRPSS